MDLTAMTLPWLCNDDSHFDFDALCEDIRTQDNRATSYPLFEVRAPQLICGVDPALNNKAKLCLMIERGGDVEFIKIDSDFDKAWTNAVVDLAANFDETVDAVGLDGQLQASSESAIESLRNASFGDEFEIHINGETEMSLTISGFIEINDIIETFLTKKAADYFIEMNGHHHKNMYVYVSSAYQNYEMRAVMRLLAEVDPSALKELLTAGAAPAP